MKNKFVRKTIARNAEGGLGKIKFRRKSGPQRRSSDEERPARQHLAVLAAKARKMRLLADLEAAAIGELESA